MRGMGIHRRKRTDPKKKAVAYLLVAWVTFLVLLSYAVRAHVAASAVFTVMALTTLINITVQIATEEWRNR